MGTKWKTISLLTLLMGGSFAAGAWASGGVERVEAFLRSDFNIVVDGKAVSLETPPLIYDDKSYLPLRKIGELLNANVNWSDDTKTIYVNPRFEGQPETPAQNEAYTEIIMQMPFAYNVTYLGGEYGVLTVTANRTIYYRDIDLQRMGVDTRGAKKSKEKYTGSLYIAKGELENLWKQQPNIKKTFGPVTSGIADPDLKNKLVALANETLPLITKLESTDKEKFPEINQVVFIDAVADHPGYYELFCYNKKNELFFYIIEMGKDSQGDWYNKSISSVSLDNLPYFFD